eukprot:SAG22_NODE_4660_length_1201_cov_2.189655_3_plen_74_part_01
MLLEAVITAFPSISLPFLAVPLRSHRTVAISSATSTTTSGGGATGHGGHPARPPGQWCLGCAKGFERWLDDLGD